MGFLGSLWLIAEVARQMARVAVLAPLLPNSVVLGSFSQPPFPPLEIGLTAVLLGLEEDQMVEPVIRP